MKVPDDRLEGEVNLTRTPNDKMRKSKNFMNS